MSLLIDEYPLVVLPKLATAIGLNEAMLLQQIHYWLGKSNHRHKGKTWVYNTYEAWQGQFPFWSVSTIRRIVTTLSKPHAPNEKDSRVQRGPLLLVDRFNKKGYDKTNWYTIDYRELQRIEKEKRLFKMNSPSVQNEQTNTRDYTENTVILSEPELVPTGEEFTPGTTRKRKIIRPGLNIKRTPLSPSTPGAEFMFTEIAKESTAQGRRAPKRFNTLAQKEMFENAEAHVGEEKVKGFVVKAIAGGIPHIKGVTFYVNRCAQEKPRAKTGEILDCDEWCPGMPPRLRAGETLIISAPPVPTSINPGG